MCFAYIAVANVVAVCVCFIRVPCLILIWIYACFGGKSLHNPIKSLKEYKRKQGSFLCNKVSAVSSFPVFVAFVQCWNRNNIIILHCCLLCLCKRDGEQGEGGVMYCLMKLYWFSPQWNKRNLVIIFQKVNSWKPYVSYKSKLNTWKGFKLDIMKKKAKSVKNYFILNVFISLTLGYNLL